MCSKVHSKSLHGLHGRHSHRRKGETQALLKKPDMRVCRPQLQSVSVTARKLWRLFVNTGDEASGSSKFKKFMFIGPCVILIVE